MTERGRRQSMSLRVLLALAQERSNEGSHFAVPAQDDQVAALQFVIANIFVSSRIAARTPCRHHFVGQSLNDQNRKLDEGTAGTKI